MKGKRIFICLLIGILLLSTTGCKREEEKAAEQAKENWEMTSDEARMSIYCALIKEYMILTEDLGENTPYPAMKRSVKGNMMSGGMTQTEALDNAEKVLIEEQAVFWRAEKEGISATDAQVEEYILTNVIDQIKQAEGYALVDEACKNEGITFEDSVWAYESSYKMEYIASQTTVTDYEAFQSYKTESVELYKQTEAYEAFQKVLDNCRNLIEDGVTDKEIIRTSDIYI